MKNLIIKFYKSLLGIVVIVLGLSSSLTAQKNEGDSVEWRANYEGNYEIAQNNYNWIGYDPPFIKELTNHVVIVKSLDKAKKIPIINSNQSIEPISIWSKADSAWLEFTSNWSAAPVFPKFVYEFDSATYYITDGYRMYKAVIDFENKFIGYTKVFQGSSGLDMTIFGYCKGKNHLYFSSNSSNLHLFDIRGVYIKTIEVNEYSISEITSIQEVNDTLMFTYTYYGPSDGSGVAKLNIETGAVTRIWDPEWSGNFSGCLFTPMGNAIYLFVWGSPKYDLDQTLLKYVNGKWIPLIQRSGTPTDINGRTLIGIGTNGTYLPTGQAMNLGDPHKEVTKFFFLEDDMTLSPEVLNWKELVRDPRLDIGFSEQFDGEFYKRHENQPNLDFLYEKNGKVFAFGNHIVATLELKNTGTTGILRNPKANSPTIYPNPAHNVLSISGLQKPTICSITDMSGKIVLLTETNDTVDISTIPIGFYILSFNGLNFRLIKTE